MEQVRVTFFGGFSAWRGTQSIKFHSNKVRALLVYLIVESNRWHHRDALATLLWENYPDQVALTNLRNALAQLRRSLEGLEHLITLEVTRSNVRLMLIEHPQITIDSHEFDILMQACAEHRHPSQTHCYLCLTRLTRAVTLYKGDFLAGLDVKLSTAFDEWLLRQRQKRFHLIMGALGTLVEHHTVINQHVQTQQYVERMLALEPWNEEAHRQMMMLLAKRGDIHAALAQYETCRQLLHAEFKSEPSAETRLVLQNIRKGTLNAGAGTRLYHVPATPTPFVGYETELAQTVEYLWNPECRLVTVLGAAGAGKTRLSIEVARQAAYFADFADGIYFLSLVALKEPEALGQAVYTTLKAQTQGRRGRTAEILQDSRALLILDGMEHLLQHGGYIGEQHDGSVFIHGLLEAAPGVKCLVTATVPLYIRAEWRYTLTGLAYPGPGISLELDERLRRYSAMDMFWRFARRINVAFNPTAVDWAAIAEICAMVEGLPLALEMAAAWVEHYTCPQIADEMKRSLNFLTTPMRDVPLHHRSIRAVCEISWQMLSPPEQQLLIAISGFSANFTVEDMISHVGSISRDELHHTAVRLADKSWLYQYSPGVFRWHSIFQRFAIDQNHSL